VFGSTVHEKVLPTTEEEAEKEKVSTLKTKYNDLLARIEALENK